MEDKENEVVELSGSLRQYGYEAQIIYMKKQSSIALFVACRTLEELEQLRRSYDDEKLRADLESLFNCLMRNRHPNHPVEISAIRWPHDDYQRCARQLTGIVKCSLYHRHHRHYCFYFRQTHKHTIIQDM